MAEHPWIIAHDGTAGDKAYSMECLRCGDTQKMALPIMLDGWLALARVFEQHHAGCKEQVERKR